MEAKHLTLLDVAFSEMIPRFKERRSYYARCALILEVVIDENKKNQHSQCLTEKQDHVKALKAYSHSQLIR